MRRTGDGSHTNLETGAWEENRREYIDYSGPIDLESIISFIGKNCDYF